jgi:hypothetical protein
MEKLNHIKMIENEIRFVSTEGGLLPNLLFEGKKTGDLGT